jgi:hypothetical protein
MEEYQTDCENMNIMVLHNEIGILDRLASQDLWQDEQRSSEDKEFYKQKLGIALKELEKRMDNTN